MKKRRYSRRSRGPRPASRGDPVHGLKLALRCEFRPRESHRSRPVDAERHPAAAIEGVRGGLARIAPMRLMSDSVLHFSDNRCAALQEIARADTCLARRSSAARRKMIASRRRPRFRDPHAIRSIRRWVGSSTPSPRSASPQRPAMGTYGAACGPLYLACGRMRRLSWSCSMQWPAQPDMRLMANMQVKRSVVMPRQ